MFKTIPIVSAAVSILVLAAGPSFAQSMFEQMPTIPGEPSAGAPSSAPAPAPTATAPSMPVAPLAAQPAQPVGAQGADCSAIQKTLLERRNLVSKANAAQASKQKMTAQQACTLFGQLTSNGATAMKWIATNKDWCSIPASFAEGFKADHIKVSGIRTKVCSMAAQATKMEAQAREGGGGGLLGGPGLTGSFKLPQGAL